MRKARCRAAVPGPLPQGTSPSKGAGGGLLEVTDAMVRDSVARALYDNFRGLTDYEKTVRLAGVPEMTLENRLWELKRQWFDKKISMGVGLYAKLRKLYTGQANPASMLKVSKELPENRGGMDQDLLVAVCDMVEGNRDRSRMMRWRDRVKACRQKDRRALVCV